MITLDIEKLVEQASASARLEYKVATASAETTQGLQAKYRKSMEILKNGRHIAHMIKTERSFDPVLLEQFITDMKDHLPIEVYQELFGEEKKAAKLPPLTNDDLLPREVSTVETIELYSLATGDTSPINGKTLLSTLLTVMPRHIMNRPIKSIKVLDRTIEIEYVRLETSAETHKRLTAKGYTNRELIDAMVHLSSNVFHVML